MSDNENTQDHNHHESQDILPSKRKSFDINLDMDITKESKIDISNSESNVVSTVPPTEQTLTNLPDLIMDNKNIVNDLEKQNFRETIDDNAKALANNTYITMKVYETYYGQQQPPQQPHQQQPIQKQSLHQNYPRQWGGVGQGTEPFPYDPGARNYFIKLVLTILLAMLVVTSVFIAFVLATDTVKNFFRRHSLMFFVLGFVLLLICHYSMFLSPCSRVPPCNIFLLLLAVAAYCVLAGNISSRYRTELVLYAAMATTAVVFVCILLACTKFDFTSWLLYVVVIATVFAVISVIIFAGALITKNYPKPLHIAMLVIGTLIQVVMLIIELQMILGGKSVELNEDDYALGAFMLYTSIMSLFMNLLQIIGLSD